MRLFPFFIITLLDIKMQILKNKMEGMVNKRKFSLFFFSLTAKLKLFFSYAGYSSTC